MKQIIFQIIDHEIIKYISGKFDGMVYSFRYH